MSLRKSCTIFLVLLLTVFVASAALLAPRSGVKAAAQASTGSNNSLFNMYARPAPNYDLNLANALGNTRQATSQQLAALEQLKSAPTARNATLRWNDFGGSVDV